jgi:hypothetical protein
MPWDDRKQVGAVDTANECLLIGGYAATGFLPEDQLPASTESHEIILPFSYDTRRAPWSESVVIVASKKMRQAADLLESTRPALHCIRLDPILFANCQMTHLRGYAWTISLCVSYSKVEEGEKIGAKMAAAQGAILKPASSRLGGQSKLASFESREERSRYQSRSTLPRDQRS